ncbi:MAG TPA: hypothetical protein VFT91_08985, partial [Dehalococcoidia bacterium]|nr:hypothetical protein [Dehalococcoidia bacterium]
SVFYPFADLGIIFAAFIIVARAGRSVPGIAFALLGAGYATNAFSDSLYIYLAQAGYETGNLIDIGWMVGNSLIALAALVRLAPVGLRSLAHPHDAAPSFWPSLIPYVPLLPLAVLLVQDVSAGEPAMLLTAGILVVIGLIVLRQILALREESRLNHELADLSALLETKVKEKTMEMLRRGRAADVEPLPLGERPNGADEPVGGLGPVHQR